MKVNSRVAVEPATSILRGAEPKLNRKRCKRLKPLNKKKFDNLKI